MAMIQSILSVATRNRRPNIVVDAEAVQLLQVLTVEDTADPVAQGLGAAAELEAWPRQLPLLVLLVLLLMRWARGVSVGRKENADVSLL